MKQHTTDWTSLIAGLTFLGIGTGAIISAETGLLFDGRWIFPGLLIVIAVGILASVRGRTAASTAEGLTPAEAVAMSELVEPPA
jgi:drug/metabolite transporter (DMT)-like permease